MKAYKAYDVNGDCSTIVFAENAGKAKAIAQMCDCCEDSRWTDIRVKREPIADKLYKGQPEIDWYDPEHRKTMVRDMGWSCNEPSWECDTCEAKEWCRWNEEGQNEYES